MRNGRETVTEHVFRWNSLHQRSDLPLAGLSAKSERRHDPNRDNQPLPDRVQQEYIRD